MDTNAYPSDTYIARREEQDPSYGRITPPKGARFDDHDNVAARASVKPDARVTSCITPIGGDYAGRIKP